MGPKRLILLFPIMFSPLLSSSPCHGMLDLFKCLHDQDSTDEDPRLDGIVYPPSACYDAVDAVVRRRLMDHHSGGSPQKVVDVRDFGGRGDGTDATKAFSKAWKEACSSQVPVVFMVPGKRNYLLKPITFSGPCKSTIIMKIMGNIEAPRGISAWDGTNHRHWILFQNIKGIHVQGGGTINGNGEFWWKNSCKTNKALPCSVAPTAITFYSCEKVRANNLRIKNSQQIHVSIEECSNVKLSHLTITAPEQSPNTDGIHVAGTTNLHITNCVIGTGDDCISIVSRSKGVLAEKIICGPGHGISIGSLGANHSEDHVSDVVVDTVRLDGTANGVRIKTWQGGRGFAQDIVFRNIEMHNVMNPIIIDQNYCDSINPCHQQKSAVEVRDVKYKNIKGTSATEVAMRFDCSTSAGCHGIMVEDINIIGQEEGKKTRSLCNNANLVETGNVVPSPCA